jgi:ankyrin repeat protein
MHHRITFNDDINTFKMLLEAGIDTTIKDNFGMTARDFAEVRQRDDIVSLIDDYDGIFVKGALDD